MAGTSVSTNSSKGAVFLRRLASTLLMWGLIYAVYLTGRPLGFLAMVGVLGIVAVLEFFRMAAAAKVPCFPRFGVLAALAYLLVLGWLLFRGHAERLYQLDVAAVFLVVAGAFTLQLRHPLRGLEPILAVGSTVVGFLYVAVFFSFAARLAIAPPGHVSAAGGVGVPGAWLLLWVVAVTKCTDMGAYVVGSLIGRHKMIPHVSPGKTWEGFGGAILFAQLVGCGLFAIPQLGLATFFGGWAHVVALNGLLALLAVVGDLAESIIKRSFSAKDSGRFLPGIGGSLDLIDSICFTAPAVFFYLLWVAA
jgi:phosphatidate cytidylyltransferase